jgi:hypothetical protein
METRRENKTDYGLTEQFMTYLCSLSPTELTIFYCETCHQRLGTAAICQPTSFFQEKQDTCFHCGRFDDVSNPHINKFLNEQGLSLTYPITDLVECDLSIDETIELFRDWLIPYDYTSYRKSDRYHQESAQFSWIKYGRKKEKEVVRSYLLSQSSKEMLLAFYPHCYSAERFALAPIVEPDREPSYLNVVDAACQIEPQLIEADTTGAMPTKQKSIIDTISSFLTTIFCNGKGNNKKINIEKLWLLLMIGILVSCEPKKEPQPALPGYLHVPTTLVGYQGSGLITITGGSLNLKAEGAEALDGPTQTYQGVIGDIRGEDITANFTLGQPRPYRDRQLVPNQYWAYGTLSIMRTITPGTYRMGIQASPGPRGELADLSLNLPGPQVYVTNSGSLTIDESTLVKSSGSASLYRIRGTFQATMYADGVGIPAQQRNPTLSGTFDLLLLRD